MSSAGLPWNFPRPCVEDQSPYQAGAAVTRGAFQAAAPTVTKRAVSFASGQPVGRSRLSGQSKDNSRGSAFQ